MTTVVESAMEIETAETGAAPARQATVAAAAAAAAVAVAAVAVADAESTK